MTLEWQQVNGYRWETIGGAYSVEMHLGNGVTYFTVYHLGTILEFFGSQEFPLLAAAQNIAERHADALLESAPTPGPGDVAYRIPSQVAAKDAQFAAEDRTGAAGTSGEGNAAVAAPKATACLWHGGDTDPCRGALGHEAAAAQEAAQAAEPVPGTPSDGGSLEDVQRAVQAIGEQTETLTRTLLPDLTAQHTRQLADVREVETIAAAEAARWSALLADATALRRKLEADTAPAPVADTRQRYVVRADWSREYGVLGARILTVLTEEAGPAGLTAPEVRRHVEARWYSAGGLGAARWAQAWQELRDRRKEDGLPLVARVDVGENEVPRWRANVTS